MNRTVHFRFIPKYRRKLTYGKLRAAIGRIIRDLREQKGVEVLGGHAISDHVHLCLKVPPKASTRPLCEGASANKRIGTRGQGQLFE